MNVTVLGGLGYIGSHLIGLLGQENIKVKVLDLELFGFSHISHLLEKENIEYQQGDIRNASDLAAVIKKSVCVIHLAGLVGDPVCSIDEDETWLHNMESSELIVDICNYYNVQKLIYSSSCSVYGASPIDMTLNEGSYLNPVSLYAKTKIDSEKLFLQKFKNSITILRLATAFGWSPRMRFDLAVNIFTIKAIRDKQIEIFGGKQFRPFLHCYDAARAFYHIYKWKKLEKINGEVFNVSAENISIKKLGELVGNIFPDIKLVITDKKEDERNYQVDQNKIEWLLGFKPDYDLVSGINNMAEMIFKKQYNDWKENIKYYNYKVGCTL